MSRFDYQSADASSRPKERKQMVCDCTTPETCSVKYHLTAKARAQLLPDRLKELKALVIELAEVVDSVERYLPQTSHRRAA